MIGERLRVTDTSNNVELAGTEHMQAPPTLERFQRLVKDGAIEPYLLSFEQVSEQRGANPAKTHTQNCVEVVEALLEDQPKDRFFAHSVEAAQSLRGRTQTMRPVRTGISETSAHQVFFATLSGANGKISVAVKPFATDRAQANITPNTTQTGALVPEWVNTLIAKERGFGAFSPIGFVATSEGGYLLTERRDDVEPMDNIKWDQALQGGEDSDSLIEDVRKIGPLLANLHDGGGFHGDPQLKNFVLGEDGRVDLIDWESAKFVDKPIWGKNTEGREDYLLGRAERDLTVLFCSLARSVEDKGVGFLDGLTTEAQWSFFQEHVMTPYLDRRLELLPEENNEAAEQAFMLIGELEEKLKTYVLNGELYRSLGRARQRF